MMPEEFVDSVKENYLAEEDLRLYSNGAVIPSEDSDQVTLPIEIHTELVKSDWCQGRKWPYAR